MVERGGTLAQRFAAQVQAGPARLAVQWGTQALSYAELQRAAKLIAAQLGALSAAASGSAPGRVGLLLGHDGAMVAGLLGVLQAGQAYVPLDAYAPAARNEQILRDAGVQTLVVDEPRLAAAPWLQQSGLTLLRLPQNLTQLPAPGRVTARRTAADELAYILYTSGSSGRPKGVAQTHRHVLAHIEGWSRQLGLTADDRLSLCSGYGFDAAVQDLFAALLHGAALYPLELRAGTASELVERIAAAQLTVLHATPTVYRYLFGGRVTCAQDLSQLRLVVLGGEAARRSDLELFKVRCARGARFINGYGLTECTVALQFCADHDTRVLGEGLPIGVPVGDIGVRLLDAHGQVHPWHGEIELSSAYLTPGYLNEPQLSAQRFSAAPAQPRRRRYRTGDLARRLPDGQLLHLGRADEQVKIRGIRIEPAEIEAALRRHPAVRECAVLARPTAAGEPALAAYVLAAAHPPAEAALRSIASASPRAAAGEHGACEHPAAGALAQACEWQDRSRGAARTGSGGTRDRRHHAAAHRNRDAARRPVVRRAEAGADRRVR